MTRTRPEPSVAAPAISAAQVAGRGGGRVRLSRLVFIRWLALLGQLGAVLLVHEGLGFPVPLLPIGAIIAASAAVNLYAAVSGRGRAWLSDRRAALYLGFDLLQLLALLALTGGLTNPFALLLLGPVVVSAAMLSRRSTLLLSGFAVMGASLLALWSLPLPWDPAGFRLPPLYIAGLWVALVLAILFIAGHVSQLALELRQRGDALAATELALAREQRLSAVGGLAAAAAHELGSPLATIAVVSRELERELPPDLPAASTLREDIALLRAEAERCRTILAGLASRPAEADEAASPFHRLPLAALVEAAAGPYLAANPASFQVMPEAEAEAEAGPQPVVPRRPEVLHGLGLLIQNALQFAESKVEARLLSDESRIQIRILDDGPGFAETILGVLGDPYVSTGGRDARSRRARAAAQAGSGEQEGEQEGEHMGLGIFIARTLLEYSGATLSFANRPAGGAEVVVAWPRHHLEAVDRP